MGAQGINQPGPPLGQKVAGFVQYQCRLLHVVQAPFIPSRQGLTLMSGTVSDR